MPMRNKCIRSPHPLAWLNVVAAATFAFGAASAHAYDIATSPYLLGDWGGLRSSLAEQGVAFNIGYGSELAHNFSGGTDHLTRYTDQWVFGTTLDLNKLWDWQGGTFQFTMTDRNGRNLGADANIGNNMLIQEVYGRGQTWHLTQLWLNQKLFDDRMEVKLGRLTVGEDFFSFSCDFQNLTFCGSQPGNLVGNYWVNWPTSQWATRIKFHTSQDTYVQTGVYQVNPKYVDDSYARHNGWKPNNPSGTTGALIPLEVGWQPTWQGRPGSYKLGGWYNTSNGNDLFFDVNHNPRGETGLDPLERSSQFGIYLSLQQQVTGTAGGRGATVFMNFSHADRNTAQLDHQITMGVQYKGPFESRGQDSIGFAVGATHNNERFADFVRQNNARTGQNAVVGSGYEYVSELYYSWSPVPSVFLRPNLQYILHPGGTSQNSNAFVIGLKTGVTF
ncbi:carbohydrate porin [Pseudogulbenkiania subflava]|uniref:Porin, OprB family n=1 Tax=Pseudogulbenkiania subflava DSM 22618 TaxID=1123014 RepID=A0A1Y6CLV7_9NEIS|nr:carbohydrate porin [Pseudogulbenkiania subflava]SMF58707.1 porin, OprB family [Pseudogulbenkiania subflava DSM 22618]